MENNNVDLECLVYIIKCGITAAFELKRNIFLRNFFYYQEKIQYKNLWLTVSIGATSQLDFLEASIR